MLARMGKRVYLDAAAAYPVRREALRAFLHASKKYGNPSAPHTEGQEAQVLLETARTSIARATGAKADAVIFTSGATESNVLAIEGAIRARLAEGAEPQDLQVLFSEAQHASVIGVLESVRARGVQTKAITCHEGRIEPDAIAKLLTPQTILVTMDAVCGETGTIFDTRAVRRALDAYRVAHGRSILLHVDATQMPLIASLDRTRLGADLITFDAQKIGGVRGIGVLIAPSNVKLLSVMPGGGQERGLRSGTPSPALAAAFATALEEAGKDREQFVARAAQQTASLVLPLTKIPGVLINGGAERAAHIINFSFPGRDVDYLVTLLDEAGFAVATRSACETDAAGSRAVLVYTGDVARAAATLRISLHADITDQNIRAFAEALTRAVRFLDDRA